MVDQNNFKNINIFINQTNFKLQMWAILRCFWTLFHNKTSITCLQSKIWLSVVILVSNCHLMPLSGPWFAFLRYQNSTWASKNRVLISARGTWLVRASLKLHIWCLISKNESQVAEISHKHFWLNIKKIKNLNLAT